jgi:hypothetical protein
MDYATLVDIDVHVGEKALEAFDDAGLKVVVALWGLTSQHDGWRLIIASPLLDQMEILPAYAKASSAMAKTFRFDTPQLLILKMTHPLIKSLRKTFSGARDVNGMRLGGQTFGQTFLIDAYVYRIQ